MPQLRIRKIVRVLLKLSILVMLTVLIASQVRWADYEAVADNGKVILQPGLSSSLTGFKYQFFVLAVLCQLSSVAVSSLRWRLLMLVQGLRMPRATVLFLTLLGEFFNHLLPGAVGGDLAKAYYMIRHTGRKGATLVSIFVNRFTGLGTLTLISGAILVVLLAAGGERAQEALQMPAYGIFLVAALLAAGIFLSVHEGLYRSELLRSIVARLPFARQIESVREALHRYRGIGPLFLPISFFSLLIVVLYILSVLCVGLSLGVDLPWYYYFLYIPLITIISSIPVTPGGVGVVEELFLYFLGSAGDHNKILAMALFCRLVLIISAIPGAIVFLFSRRVTREEINATVGDLTVE